MRIYFEELNYMLESVIFIFCLSVLMSVFGCEDDNSVVEDVSNFKFEFGGFVLDLEDF